MIEISESTRENPAEFKCCGEKVAMHLHWDYLEGVCRICGKIYTIRTLGNIWNCCMAPDNSLLDENGRVYSLNQAKEKYASLRYEM